MYHYICVCDAHFVIHSLVNSALPCVSLCPVLRADERSCRVVDTPATAKALQILEGRVEQATRKQSVSDSVHEIKVEIKRVEHEAIRAHQVIE